MVSRRDRNWSLALLFAAGHRPPSPIGVGLLGYGAIARDHASLIARVGGLRVGAVCDTSGERRELATRELGVPVYGSAHDMYDDPDIGLVLVGTPPAAHAGTVLEALAAGKDVVCEKPFALRVEEVCDLAARIRGEPLATAMLPPGGRDDGSFRPIIVGPQNSDPYPVHGEAIATLGKHFGIALERARCYPYRG